MPAGGPVILEPHEVQRTTKGYLAGRFWAVVLIAAGALAAPLPGLAVLAANTGLNDPGLARTLPLFWAAFLGAIAVSVCGLLWRAELRRLPPWAERVSEFDWGEIPPDGRRPSVTFALEGGCVYCGGTGDPAEQEDTHKHALLEEPLGSMYGIPAGRHQVGVLFSVCGSCLRPYRWTTAAFAAGTLLIPLGVVAIVAFCGQSEVAAWVVGAALIVTCSFLLGAGFGREGLAHGWGCVRIGLVPKISVTAPDHLDAVLKSD